MALQGGSFETASTALGAKLMEWLRRTSIPLPEVRKGAFRESLRSAPDENTITDVIMEALHASPSLDDESKEKLVTMYLDGRFSDLSEAVLPPPRTGDIAEAHLLPEPFEEFKSMATNIFCKSRKIAHLNRERRMQLGGAILVCRNREQLVDLLMRSLDSAETLDDQARCLIANDVFDERYYRLLLPDRFDCSEAPVRTVSLSAVDDFPRELECPVCFECCNESSVELTCSHRFCEQCVSSLSAASLNRSFPCPMCRQMFYVVVDEDDTADTDDDGSQTHDMSRWSFRRLRRRRYRTV